MWNQPQEGRIAGEGRAGRGPRVVMTLTVYRRPVWLEEKRGGAQGEIGRRQQQ